jgi:3-oxoadipate enol-lactonase
MPVFKYGKQDLYYELHGREGDPVVTLVNGLSMRTAHWAPYFQFLPAQGCRVLSYDLLGQGFSSKPVLGVDFDDHTRMLHALHEHLGIERPYVMGISFGGVVALKYALLYPRQIAGAIPASTFSELDEQLRGHAANLYMGLTRVGFEFYLDLLMPLNFTNPFLAQGREMNELMKRAGVAGNELYGIQNVMESLARFESMTDAIPGIACPTLILNGEFDYLTPRHLHEIMRRQIANSRLVIIPNMAHAFTLEVPALTARVLAEFVKTVEGGAWEGDRSVWVCDENWKAPQLLKRAAGDHLRFLPALAEQAAKPAPEAAKPKTRAPRKAAARKPAAKKPAKSPAKVKR